MAYVKTQDGVVLRFPYTVGMLRQDNPRTSFPRRIPTEVLAEWGVFEVDVDDPPAVDEKNYKAVRAETPVEVSGKWVLQWSVVEKTAKEKQQYYDGRANQVRSKRDSMLAETDWMALNDTPPMSDAWVSYRRALRDITDQAGFPYDVTWPEKPSS